MNKLGFNRDKIFIDRIIGEAAFRIKRIILDELIEIELPNMEFGIRDPETKYKPYWGRTHLKEGILLNSQEDFSHKTYGDIILIPEGIYRFNHGYFLEQDGGHISNTIPDFESRYETSIDYLNYGTIAINEIENFNQRYSK